MRRYCVVAGIAFLLIGAGVLATSGGRNLGWAAYTRLRGRHTVADRLHACGADARQRMLPHFRRAGVSYPPGAVAFLAIKDQRQVQVYAGADDQSLTFITAYPVHGQSGNAGPKLCEGDRQVPEGRYRIESLNPNSRFHLALRLGYPNAFDQLMGERDGRDDLGSDIMIHGGSASVGCLAMGNEVAEELFVLVAEAGHDNAFVVIVPVDFRGHGPWHAPTHLPAWTDELYAQLRVEVQAFPVQNAPS